MDYLKLLSQNVHEDIIKRSYFDEPFDIRIEENDPDVFTFSFFRSVDPSSKIRDNIFFDQPEVVDNVLEEQINIICNDYWFKDDMFIGIENPYPVYPVYLNIFFKGDNQIYLYNFDTNDIKHNMRKIIITEEAKQKIFDFIKNKIKCYYCEEDFHFELINQKIVSTNCLQIGKYCRNMAKANLNNKHIFIKGCELIINSHPDCLKKCDECQLFLCDNCSKQCQTCKTYYCKRGLASVKDGEYYSAVNTEECKTCKTKCCICKKNLCSKKDNIVEYYDKIEKQIFKVCDECFVVCPNEKCKMKTVKTFSQCNKCGQQFCDNCNDQIRNVALLDQPICYKCWSVPCDVCNEDVFYDDAKKCTNCKNVYVCEKCLIPCICNKMNKPCDNHFCKQCTDQDKGPKVRRSERLNKRNMIDTKNQKSKRRKY